MTWWHAREGDGSITSYDHKVNEAQRGTAQLKQMKQEHFLGILHPNPGGGNSILIDNYSMQ
jgi:hypothetical protein